MSGDVRASAVVYEMKLSEEMLSAWHPSIKGIFVSSLHLCLSAVALLNYTACMLLVLLSGADMATLLACAEPSFDMVPRRLSCVFVVMCCRRLVCKGQRAQLKTGVMWFKSYEIVFWIHLCVYGSNLQQHKQCIRTGSWGVVPHTPDWPGSSWQLSVPRPVANFSTSFLLAQLSINHLPPLAALVQTNFLNADCTVNQLSSPTLAHIPFCLFIASCFPLQSNESPQIKSLKKPSILAHNVLMSCNLQQQSRE